MSGRGVLFLVVGPSGVGKDTLIDAARGALADDRRFVFPQRVITRPDEAGGEDHQAASFEQFAELEAQGAFLLSWEAHGLRYGVPIAAEAALAQGRHVIANVSRGVIGDARARFSPVRVLSITASPEALRARLVTRGREAVGDIEGRIARAGAYQVTGPDVIAIANDLSREHGVALFLGALGAGNA